MDRWLREMSTTEGHKLVVEEVEEEVQEEGGVNWRLCWSKKMRRTTLHCYWLCRCGHYSHFKFYLNKKLFRLQLQSYPQAGNSDAVELFIDQTDSKRYINELNKEHEGPLHFASRLQSRLGKKQLLPLNQNMTIDRSADKRTVELLVKNGAKVLI